jgi:hypothetical protein
VAAVCRSELPKKKAEVCVAPAEVLGSLRARWAFDARIITAQSDHDA